MALERELLLDICDLGIRGQRERSKEKEGFWKVLHLVTLTITEKVMSSLTPLGKPSVVSALYHHLFHVQICSCVQME